MRQFYLIYADRVPPALHSPGTELAAPEEIGHTVCAKSGAPPRPLSSSLSWSHYRVLMGVAHAEARSFYEVERATAGWSVRELQRQVASLLFERLARSRDREGVLALAREGHEVSRPADLVKDPYVLEFAGLPETSRWLESDLENALIDRLRHFLLELGRDLFFVARQQRITIDGDHFYIDLVFYHRFSAPRGARRRAPARRPPGASRSSSTGPREPPTSRPARIRTSSGSPSPP